MLDWVALRPSTRSLCSLAQDEETFFVAPQLVLILSKRSASKDAGCRCRLKEGEHHAESALLSAKPARLQGAGVGPPPRDSLRAPRPRSPQGRAEAAGIRGAQSQHADARHRGRRLRTLGGECDPAVSRREESGAGDA